MFVIGGEGLDQLGKTEFFKTMTKHLSSLKTRFDEVQYVKFPFTATWEKYDIHLEANTEKQRERGNKAEQIKDMITRRQLFDADFNAFVKEGGAKANDKTLFVCDRTNISNLVYFFIEYYQICGDSRVPTDLFNIPNSIAMANFLKLEEVIFPKIDILVYSPYSFATMTFLKEGYGVQRDNVHGNILDYHLTLYGDAYYRQIIDRQMQAGKIGHLITPKSFVGLKDYTETIEAIVKLI